MARLLNTLLVVTLLTASTAHAATAALHDMLPTDAIAYLRVVGPGGFSGAAAETPLGDAIAAADNGAVLEQVARSAVKRPLPGACTRVRR